MKPITTRPLEVVHDFTFVPIHMPQDKPLTPPIERIKKLKKLGYGGIVINLRLDGYPYDVSDFKSWVECAKENGLRVWIYDEKLYPSGSVGGELVHKYPEYEAKTVCMESAESDDTGMLYINSPRGCSSAIAAFTAELDESGRVKTETLKNVTDKIGYGGGLLIESGRKKLKGFCFFERRGFEYCRSSYTGRTMRRVGDLLSKKAVDKFLDMTFSAYKEALGSMPSA